MNLRKFNNYKDTFRLKVNLYKAFYQVFALISSKGSQSPLIFISVQIILQTHFFLQVYNKVFKIHHKLIKACFVLFSSKMY